MNKSFFSEKYHGWTEEANKIDHEIVTALQPIFDKYAAEGYSPREIGHMVSHAGMYLEMKNIAYARIKASKEEQ